MQQQLQKRIERYKKSNLRRLWALAALFGIVFVLFLCYLQSMQHSRMQERAKERIEHSSAHVTENILAHKSTMLREAFTFASTKQQLLNSAITFASKESKLHNIVFYSSRGRALFDLRGHNPHKKLAKELTPAAGEAKSGFVQDSTGRRVFRIVIPAGNEAGYIGADYDLGLLLKPIRQLLGQKAYFFAQKKPLQDSPDAFILDFVSKEPSYNMCLHRHYVIKDTGGASKYMPFSFTPLHIYNPAGLSVTVFSKIDAFAKESKTVYGTLFALVAAMLLLVTSLFLGQLETYKKYLLQVFESTSQRIRRQKQRYESFFDKLSVAACILDADRKITLANEQFCSRLGYDNTQVTQRGLEDFLADEKQQKRLQTAFNDAGHSGESGQVTLLLRRADGAKMEALLSIGPDYFEKSGGFLMTFIDVTKARADHRALEKNRSYLQAIFTAQPEILVITDGKTIDTANKAFFDFTGFANLDSFAKQYDCICELFLPREGYLQPAIEGESWIKKVLHNPQHPHKVMMAKDHIPYIFSVRAKAFESGGREKAVVLFSDITEDENLKLRYQFAIEGSSDGLWDVDLIRKEVYFSPRWKQMLGYKDEAISRDMDEWWNRIHPDDVDQVRQSLDKAIAYQEKIFENIHRLEHKNGGWIWIFSHNKIVYDSGGNAVRIVGMHNDITDLKMQQNEIELLQNALDSSPIGIVITDADARIQYHNKWLEQLTGYAAFELYKQPITSFLSPNNDEAKQKQILQTTETGELWKGIFEMKRKDGSVYEEHNTIAAIFEDGEITHYIGIKQELKGEAKLHYELQEKEEMMLAQSRSAAMGEMIGMIAHQWRQPIATIAMGINNILADIELGTLEQKQLQQHLHDISVQTAHLSQTIDDFKDFFKPNKEPIYTTADECVKQALEIIGKSVRNNNITLHTDLYADNGVYTYDREVLQVLLNIIKNAKEALLHRGVREPYIQIETQNSDGGAFIRICDNAGGVKKEHIYKVFDPYFTTKSEQNGTGLGLYMSKMITDRHLGGSLHLHNTQKGCCFTLTLPPRCNEGENDV